MTIKTLQLYKIKSFCKHCKKELENVWLCKLDSVIGIKYALLCVSCQKLIRVSSSIDYFEKL